ncbi:MAG: V-type ATP synthase subunit D [Lentisphaeria bacterium]
MAKVKLTKNELKKQQDDLQRFSRYLPTLQLKKQQLQLETRLARQEIRKLEDEEKEFRRKIRDWIYLLDEQSADTIKDIINVESLQTGIRNIAGVDTPVFKDLVFTDPALDLFATPAWFDDMIETVRQLTIFRLRHQILKQRLEALEAELRTTTQRVNLFEKVKIPEARDNIRRIQIYLGDQQTAQVGRAKIAKRKTQALRT